MSKPAASATQQKRSHEAAKMGRTAANISREAAGHARSIVEDAHNIVIASVEGDNARVQRLAHDIAVRGTGVTLALTYQSANDYAKADGEIMDLNKRDRARKANKS